MCQIVKNMKMSSVMNRNRIFVFFLIIIGINLIECNDNETEGYCAPYNGKICKSFVSSNQVWYSKEHQHGWANERITTDLWNELISGLQGLCRKPAEVIQFPIHIILYISRVYLF